MPRRDLRGGIANSADPDQTDVEEQSDEGLHCLLGSVCQNPWTKYGNFFLG